MQFVVLVQQSLKFRSSNDFYLILIILLVYIYIFCLFNVFFLLSLKCGLFICYCKLRGNIGILNLKSSSYEIVTRFKRFKLIGDGRFNISIRYLIGCEKANFYSIKVDVHPFNFNF